MPVRIEFTQAENAPDVLPYVMVANFDSIDTKYNIIWRQDLLGSWSIETTFELIQEALPNDIIEQTGDTTYKKKLLCCFFPPIYSPMCRGKILPFEICGLF